MNFSNAIRTAIFSTIVLPKKVIKVPIKITSQYFVSNLFLYHLNEAQKNLSNFRLLKLILLWVTINIIN